MKRLLAVAIITLASQAHAEGWVSPAQYAAAKNPAAGQAMEPLSSNPTYFSITAKDVEKKVAENMAADGVAEQVEVNLLPSGIPVLYKTNHPIQLVVHALQIDPDAKRWQAEAYIMSEGKTESVKPVSGRYDELVKVPMLVRQMGSKDVISMEDIELRLVPARKLRKDTVLDVDQLIGKSARQMISANRMMRMAEITAAITIEKDHQVEMVYNTPYMSIRTMGKALENGTTGELIRVMNHDTQRSVSARVIDSSRVEVNPATTIN